MRINYREEARDGLVDPLATNFKSVSADWKTGANFRYLENSLKENIM
jgi:hypothetical protein